MRKSVQTGRGGEGQGYRVDETKIHHIKLKRNEIIYKTLP